MDQKNKVTIHIGNHNGMRNALNGKGRIQTTIESLMRCCPFVTSTDLRIIDNFSTDGSFEYLSGLRFGKLERRPRIEASPSWMATTINNLRSLSRTVLSSDRDYVWNIENDSFFYDEDFFLKAVEVLEANPNISLVHLRGYVPLDSINSPGVPRNRSRVSEIRRSTSGFDFYIKEKRPEYALWIPLESWELGLNFKPDENPGLGKCPVGVNAIGALRRDQKGGYERLLTEYWNSYVSNGWIARKVDLRRLLEHYNPLGERQMAIAFKKHFTAAKLSRDAFVCFGWKDRANPREEEVLDLFKRLQSGEDFRKRFLKVRPDYEAGRITIPDDKINIYD